MEKKEKRIRAVTQLYYSNPKVQEALLKFSKDREVVPRYFEVFGKRPDMIQYASDVVNLVKNGATSFHASEELWNDPLKLSAELNINELNEVRKGWDLLIDIDSQFLDYAKIAALLIIELFEYFGIKNYGIKFSGSRGFHIIISSKAFPKEYGGIKTKEMFPAWPRAVSEYLMNCIRKEYNQKIGNMLINFEALEKRTRLKKEDLEEVVCETCGKKAAKGTITTFNCDVCNMIIERKNVKIIKKRLKCLNADCAGILVPGEIRDYFYCENCFDSENKNIKMSSDKYPENFEKVKGISAEKIASPDLILVSPRHLFRMPYSLHEKTALASVVLTKKELESFSPKDADPLKIKIVEFLPDNEEGEAKKLLAAALDWKKGQESLEKEIQDVKYKDSEFAGFNLEMKNIDEKMFPEPIKKLLLGLNDGRKRGLFILITFLRKINYTPEQINKTVREWNEKNTPPLKEGYVRSQIEWHLKQKRKIMPPNYSNESFYKDLGLLEKKPSTKNPLVDVMRNLRRK